MSKATQKTDEPTAVPARGGRRRWKKNVCHALRRLDAKKHKKIYKYIDLHMPVTRKRASGADEGTSWSEASTRPPESTFARRVNE